MKRDIKVRGGRNIQDVKFIQFRSLSSLYSSFPIYAGSSVFWPRGVRASCLSVMMTLLRQLSRHSGISCAFRNQSQCFLANLERSDTVNRVTPSDRSQIWLIYWTCGE